MAKRATYHHGDLRRVLLDASLALVNEVGVGAISLREVARKAGVSHNAPYHHFPDKGSVLAAIALEGLEMLSDAMATAIAKAGDDPKARLEACGFAYVSFALSHAAHFRVMFRPELACAENQSAMFEAGEKPFGHVVATVVGCQEAGLLPPGDPLPTVLTCWSAVHGLASLWLDGPLPQDAEGFGKSPEKLAEMVVFTLSQRLLRPEASTTGKVADRRASRASGGDAGARPSRPRRPSKAADPSHGPERSARRHTSRD